MQNPETIQSLDTLREKQLNPGAAEDAPEMLATIKKHADQARSDREGHMTSILDHMRETHGNAPIPESQVRLDSLIEQHRNADHRWNLFNGLATQGITDSAGAVPEGPSARGSLPGPKVSITPGSALNSNVNYV